MVAKQNAWKLDGKVITCAQENVVTLFNALNVSYVVFSVGSHAKLF